MKKTAKENNWIKIENRLSVKDENCVTVAFSKKQSQGSCCAYLGLGTGVLRDMQWNIGDNISIYHDKHNPLLWMICKTETGRALRKGTKKCSALTSLMWHKDIPFNATTSCKFKLYKDKIIVEVRK